MRLLKTSVMKSVAVNDEGDVMRTVLNVLTALVVVLAVGCGRSQGPGEQARPLKLAVVTNNSSDWWTIARKGGEKAADKKAPVQATT